jgi:hypothetical protein
VRFESGPDRLVTVADEGGSLRGHLDVPEGTRTVVTELARIVNHADHPVAVRLSPDATWGPVTASLVVHDAAGAPIARLAGTAAEFVVPAHASLVADLVALAPEGTAGGQGSFGWTLEQGA